LLREEPVSFGIETERVPFASRLAFHLISV
jgi:hypothetical protein